MRSQNCRWNRTERSARSLGGGAGHVNIISIRCPSEAVEEAAAYQGKIGSRLEVYQEIGEMLNLRILIPWTQGGSN